MVKRVQFLPPRLTGRRCFVVFATDTWHAPTEEEAAAIIACLACCQAAAAWFTLRCVPRSSPATQFVQMFIARRAVESTRLFTLVDSSSSLSAQTGGGERAGREGGRGVERAREGREGGGAEERGERERGERENPT